MRVVSLVPAATEIVGSLGLTDQLVGVSHECEYPPEVNAKPRVTHCPIHEKGLPSAEVDRWVREALATQGTLYTLNEPLLHELKPDVILTQRLCDVCAVGYGSVAALAAALPGPPRVVSLEPSCLADVLENIRQVARVLGVPERGESVTAAGRPGGSGAVARGGGSATASLLPAGMDRPTVLQRPLGAGVGGAGGRRRTARPQGSSLHAHFLGKRLRPTAGSAGPRLLRLWHGGELSATFPSCNATPVGRSCPAVRQGRVYLIDGSAYFSRPGPRVVDSLEILAEILHPDLFAGWFPDRAVVRISEGG